LVKYYFTIFSVLFHIGIEDWFVFLFLGRPSLLGPIVHYFEEARVADMIQHPMDPNAWAPTPPIDDDFEDFGGPAPPRAIEVIDLTGQPAQSRTLV
jgi:hypothetical protein